MNHDDIIPILKEHPKDIQKTELNKIPMTVITGYLGSGKTTLLQYVLNENHGKRIAVILNDFGDASGVDKTRILQTTDESVAFEEWLELRNGCICCSVKDVGLKMVENLISKKGAYDYILIETNGLADPGSLASLFWIDEELESQVELDGMVTVVDSKNFFNHYDEANRFQLESGNMSQFIKQILAADRIILNKKDLVSVQDLESVSQILSQMNSFAPILETSHSRLNLDFLFDIKAYDKASSSTQDLVRIENKLNSFKNSVHHEDSSIKTICVVLKRNEQVNLMKFEIWLQSLLWEKILPGVEEFNFKDTKVEIIRMKGFVNIKEISNKVVYQGVCELFEQHVVGEWDSDLEKETRMIFIGRNLNALMFQQSLRHHALL